MRLHLLDLRPLRALAVPAVLAALTALTAGCNSQGMAEEPLPMPIVEGDLPACAGEMAHYFDRGAIQPPGQGTGYDADQERVVGAVFAQAFALGVEGDLAGMAALLDAEARIEHPHEPGRIVPAYTVCQDAGLGAVLFRPVMGSGLPVMAWRPGDARRVIVEAPHPWFELHTREQGVEAFFEHRARALIVSGAHRCSSHAEVVCSGTTSVCGEAGAYRESDPAHNPESVFHAMHVALTEAYRTHFAISLHGVRHHRVVVSDGTDLAVGAEGPIGAAALDLHHMLEGEAEVESCNGVREMGQADRYCGTTNAQGRHLNGAEDVCIDSAGHSAHRFLHLEQPMHVRSTADLRRAVILRIFDRLDPLGAR